MKQSLLSLYQLLTGLSDTSTGILLLAAPAFTLHMMHLHIDAVTLPYLSYIGAFVLSVGLACLYGARLAGQANIPKLEVVWLLTAITRGVVATFVTWKIATGVLEPGWATVALSDGAFALFQFAGLAKGWLDDALA